VRDAASKGTTSDFQKAEYFYVRDWTADSALNCLMNFDFSRGRLVRDFARHDPATGGQMLPVGQIGG
jgi:hypothetical protein